jgi:hypothetical protein
MGIVQVKPPSFGQNRDPQGHGVPCPPIPPSFRQNRHRFVKIAIVPSQTATRRDTACRVRPYRRRSVKIAIVPSKSPSFRQNRHRSVKTATGLRAKQRWNGHGTPCPCKGGEHTGTCGIFRRFPCISGEHTPSPLHSLTVLFWFFLTWRVGGSAPRKRITKGGM